MWNPPIALSPEEQKIAARPKRRGTLLYFSQIRHELLDADFSRSGQT